MEHVAIKPHLFEFRVKPTIVALDPRESCPLLFERLLCPAQLRPERLQLSLLFSRRFTEFSYPFPSDRYLVAVDQRDLHCRRLVLTALAGSESANPVGV